MGEGDVTACCKAAAAAATCDSVKDDGAFCGNKVYDATKDTESCATATCTKTTEGDVTACCKATNSTTAANSTTATAGVASTSPKTSLWAKNIVLGVVMFALVAYEF